jgi:membrane protein DedA with SNARE-associated domain
MYIALVSGDFVADIGWYCVGRFGGRPIVLKWGHRFGITLKSIEKIEERFKRYHDKILIISKLTMGFGFALVTLVVAGMLRVSFKKYAVLNLIGGFVWTAVLLLVGYFFGNIYASITGPEKIVFAICLFALAVTAFKLANKYLITQNI